MSCTTRRRGRAFTMIELIVAIVVISVLAAIAIVGYRTVIDNANDSAAEETLRSFHREVSALAVFDGDCSADDADVTAAAADLPDGWTHTEAWSASEREISTDAAVAVGQDCGRVGYGVVSSTGNCILGVAEVGAPLDTGVVGAASALGGGCSGYSALLDEGDRGPISFDPDAPEDLDAANSATSVDISWAEVDHPFLSGYRVYNNAGGALLGTNASDDLTFTAGGLTTGTAYTWDVEAFTAAGQSPRTSLTAVARPAFTKVESGGTHSCGLGSNGTVWCWGNGQNGQNGDASTAHRPYPVRVNNITNATDITVTETASCARLADTTARCWGLNGQGQLGNGVSGAFQQSTSAQTVCVPGGCAGGALTGVSSLVTGFSSGGGGTTCALVSGAVYCWGSNLYGQVGDGTSGSGTNRALPRAVGGQMAAGVTALAGSGSGFCGLKGGNVYCWGWNDQGQLGAGGVANTPTHSATPVQVSGVTNAMKLSSGGSGKTFCAVLADTTVSCWGWNHNGQIGDGTLTTRTAPVTATQLGSGVTQVAVAGNFTCALNTDGTLRCLGGNISGQFGNGIVSPSSGATCPSGGNGDDLLSCGYSTVAQLADVTAVTQVSVGTTQFGTGRTCVITSGRARCVGSMQFGGLGNSAAVPGATNEATFQRVW